MISSIPDGSICAMDGLYYKIGRFDKPYYWNGREWIRSEKSKERLMADIKRNEIRNKSAFSMNNESSQK